MNKKSTYVFPTNNAQSAKYIIVGEFPGIAEVTKGRPFSGKDGLELDNCLHVAGISRSDCYFTYVIKDVDRPIGHYIEFTRKGPIIHPEGQEYIDILMKELSACPAQVIIAFGDIALFALADRTGVTKWRGSVIRPILLGDKWMIPMNSPATNIFPIGNFKNKRLLIYDLKRAKSIVTGNWNPITRYVKISPTYSEVLNFLHVCEYYGLLNHIIFYDIECDMFNKEMTCISFAYSPTDVISIPFIGNNGDYFSIPQEIEILKKIASILENPKIPIGGQNLCFDSHYMLRKYGICATNMHDTMVAQKTLLPDYPVGLHFICSTYTDLPYYKEDGKYWLKGIGTFEGGWRYNALDSIVCADAHPKQVRDLLKQHNYTAYLRKCKSIPAYVYIMEKGIRINILSMKKAYDDMEIELKEVLKQLHALCGFELNPNSPKQVKEYFYITKRLPAYKGKSGNDTTDEKALKRIAGKGFKEASLILKLRGLTKERSTFLDINKVDTDGRMRCSYNVVGTRYARVSSSENIFGTGNNFQNQPHRILSHFFADYMNVYYGMDLSQAENRIVAYEGRITQMIECFETGRDVHSLVANMMAQLFFNNKLPADFDPRKTLAPIGDGHKPWRDWGKKTGHAANYDISAQTLALYNEIPLKEGKIILDIYHKGFPGVRQGYHAYVQRNINTNRTLTNLMGRKTLFTDRLDDNLYKEAYACIPQGTVGDVIDERGINFIYYQKNPLFKNVELLIQIHDQIGFQIPSPYHPTNPVPWEDHSTILKMVKQSLETPLYTHYHQKFVIPVDTCMGTTLNKDLSVDLNTLSPDELEKSYSEVLQRWLPMTI